MTRDEFLTLFDPVDRFLAAHSAEVSCGSGELVSNWRLGRAEKKLGFALHATVRWFYQTVGDGVYYRWESEEHGLHIFYVPSIKDLLKDKRRIEVVAKHWLEAKGENSDILAQFRKALSWAPITNEGNGDSLCWDLATGEVVFDNHSFFDGQTETPFNGRIAGDTMVDFIRNWSRFCFQDPTGLWWGALEEGNDPKLHWKPDYFPSDCVLPESSVRQ